MTVLPNPSPVPHADLSASSPSAGRLRAASLVLILSGIGFALAAVVAPDTLARFYRLVSAAGTVTTMDAAARLGAALFGALTFGWGITIWRLADGDSAPRALVRGASAWFVADSAASIALGYGWNTVSNAIFLAVLLLLLRGAREAS